MMKRYILMFICYSFITVCNGQFNPQYKQYLLNNQLTSPAFAGVNNFASVNLGYANQLMGLDGNPKSYYLSANMPIGENVFNGYDDESIIHERHHGAGVVVMSDKIGPYKSLSVNLSYSYHLPISDQLNLSFGVSGGILQFRFDSEKNLFPDQQIDPTTGDDEIFHKISPDVSFGLMLYHEKFFTGLSLHKLIKTSYSNKPNQFSFNNSQLVWYSGYRLDLNEELSVVPSVLLQTTLPSSTQVDINTKLNFRNLVWIGGSIRKDSQYSVLCGISPLKLLSFNYIYDFSGNGEKSLKYGSHRFALNFNINKVTDWVNPLW